MPAPRTDIDRAGVCTKAAIAGIRETARHFHLPVSTVKDICHAHGVILPTSAQRLVRVTQPFPSVPFAQSAQPHSIVTEELHSLGERSRLAAAQIGARVLPGIAKMGLGRMIEHVEQANTTASLQQKANIPGWERQQDRPSIGVVNIALLGQELPERIATARVVEE